MFERNIIASHESFNITVVTEGTKAVHAQCFIGIHEQLQYACSKSHKSLMSARLEHDI